MQHALIKHGFITTHIYLKPQDLMMGTLNVNIIPGRIHALTHHTTSNRRISLWSIMPSQPEDLLNLRDIEHGLENLRRLPSADASIAIQAARNSSADGYSDLVIGYVQNRPLRLAVGLDDGGSMTGGTRQGSLALSYDNGWALGDLLNFSFTQGLGGANSDAKGNRSLATHYSFPWRKWLVSFHHTSSGYRRSISGAHRKYVYQGSNKQVQFKISRLAWRSANHRISAYIQAFLRRSRSYIDDTEIEVQRRHTGGWEAGLHHRAYLGAAIADTSIAIRRGTGAFGSIPSPEQNFGEGTARFKIISTDSTLHWPWRWGKRRLSHSIHWRAQWNRTPLTPEERFTIGGRYSVRGFDSDQSLMADRGWVLRNEIALALGNGRHHTYSGLDIGSVGGPASKRFSGHRLSGIMLGLRGNHKSLSYDLFAGVPLHKPRHMQTSKASTGFTVNYQF